MLLINPNRKELDKLAIKEDKVKRAIEQDFSRDLQVLFRRILRELKRSYSAIGLIPDQVIYRDEFINIIKKYQTKTADIFSGSIRDNKIKSIKLFERKQADLELDEKESENIEEQVAIAMTLWVDEQSVKQTDIIIETNTEQIQEAISTSREELRTKGDKIFGDKEIIAAAILSLKSKFINRSELIAVQNVLMTSNEAKLNEAEAINKSSIVAAGIKIADKTRKNWNAVLDSKTRAAHVQADFTYYANPIRLNETFIVMGESLKYPGDPNGSAANIMNCRCTMQTFIVE